MTGDGLALYDGFCLLISGAANKKTDREMWFNDYITFEFPTSSPDYAIVRKYYEDGVMYEQTEYKNGLMNGRSVQFWRDGSVIFDCAYLNGEVIRNVK